MMYSRAALSISVGLDTQPSECRGASYALLSREILEGLLRGSLRRSKDLSPPSLRKTSTMPAASGASGPTTV